MKKEWNSENGKWSVRIVKEGRDMSQINIYQNNFRQHSRLLILAKVYHVTKFHNQLHIMAKDSTVNKIPQYVKREALSLFEL